MSLVNLAQGRQHWWSHENKVEKLQFVSEVESFFLESLNCCLPFKKDSDAWS
jgi:hypothetical protein